MNPSILIGLGVAGAAIWYYFSKRGTGTASGAPSATATQALFASSPATQAAPTPSTQPAQIGQAVGTVGGAGVGAIFGSPQAGAAIGGILGSIGGAIFSAFQGKPLSPVKFLLIAEMPYGYTDRNNVPPGATIYALDRYGFLHYLPQINECGFSWREIVAVNWKVFSMLQKSGRTICDPREYEPMPRPADPALLRGAFGNDIRFKIGSDNNVHGPWEGGAVTPIAGTAAAWAQVAGEYRPTVVSTPGDF